MSTQDKIYDLLRKTLFVEVVILVLIISGCYPPAASMQDARVIGKGGARLTGYWYGLEDAGAGGEKVADVYGGLIGIGSSDRTEIQFRLDHFEFPEEDGGGRARDPHAAVTPRSARRSGGSLRL